jgi:type VI secretion system secreted protein Hcp
LYPSTVSAESGFSTDEPGRLARSREEKGRPIRCVNVGMDPAGSFRYVMDQLIAGGAKGKRMSIYMKYANIKGPVTTEGFKDWIELNSFQWGVGRAIGTAARGSTSREHSEPSLSEVNVTKMTDIASPKLFTESVAGELNSKVTIKFTTTTKGKVETFLTYELTDTGISGYSLSSGGEMPSESLSLNFTKISKTFTGMDPATSGSPETVGYDLTQMKTT